MEPGGHEFAPLLIEQQNTVQPDEQLASGPHNDAYAVPGSNANLNGLTASADPTTADRIRNPRRLDRRASPALATSTSFEVMLMRLRPPALDRPCDD
jgi:hypothetical protein